MTHRKLSRFDLKTVRVLFKNHSQAAIATHYDVSKGTINNVLREKNVFIGKGFRKVRKTVTPVAKVFAQAQALFGK